MNSVAIEVGQQIQLEITGLTHEGNGVGRAEGLVVFVPKALLGEKVLVEITSIKKTLANAKVVEVIEPSAARIDTGCSFAANCGGCNLQHSSYEEQLRMKTQIVQDAMNKIGKVDIDVLPTIGMENPVGYRNKGVFHLDKRGDKVKLGFFQQGTKDLVPADACGLFSPTVNQLVKHLEEVLAGEKQTKYVTKVMIRESKANGEIMIVFVIDQKQDKLSIDLEAITTAFPQVVSMYININLNPKLMLGTKFRLIYGVNYIEDMIGDKTFQISPRSFFQVNNVQAEVLYKKAVEYARLTGEEIVVDAYCGIGTISLFLAEHAEGVYGIESVEGAIKDAKINAQENKIKNVEFVAAKTEEWLPAWAEEGYEADVIVVDPPRKGCDQWTLDAMVKVAPKTVVYVSCNPSTLARDIAFLVENGYQVNEVQPVDMFPFTGHVEMVTQLTKK